MSTNMIQDRKDSGKAGVQSAGNEKQPKKVYSFRQINDMLSQKDKEGTYRIQSMDEAMEMIPAKTGLETEAFQKERWELVKSIFYCFHSTTTGMPKSLRDEYKPQSYTGSTWTRMMKELELKNTSRIPCAHIDF